MTLPSTTRVLLACLLLPALLLVNACTARTGEISLVNAGFEEAGNPQDAVPGWRLNQHAGSPAYEMSIDATTAATGHASFRMRRLTRQFYGSIAQQVAVPKGSGARSAVLTARMKTQDVGRKGWVLVMTIVAADGNRQIQATPLNGTHDFTEVTVRAKLPDGVQAIEVGALLLDDGTAWLDDVHLRLDAE